MKTLYWNINKSLTDSKLDWIDKAISEQEPDIFCIAEGPEGVNDCNNLVHHLTKKNYYSYYSPTLYSETVISNQYGWNKLGLKVFVKNGLLLKSRFAFGNQKTEGRIVYLRFEKNGEFYSMFLIHGMSKAGDDLNQNNFVIELSQFIMTKTINKENDKIIVLGDFNIEPWEELLRTKRYIYSLFYKKLQEYYSAKAIKRIYTNPAFEYIQTHNNQELVGTFYNDNYISLFDYPLLSNNITNTEFEIITQISGTDILVKKNSKNILVDGFDHLPITLKILENGTT
jgi:endonuclease/exonuclease/phosphatase family metal-dependent hydrolase